MTTFNLAFACYFAALLAYAAAYLFARPSWRAAGLAAMGVAWLLQTAFLILRWQVSGHVPLANQFESLVSMSWGATLLSFWFQSRARRKGGETWIAPATVGLSLVLLAVCSLLDSSVAPLVPALRSNWLLFHVAVIMLGYAALALSFLTAVVYLASLGRRPAEERAKAADRLNLRAMRLGYLLLTVGIILGAVWANEAWGSYWSWDPKETWSLVTWLVYTAGLHLNRTHRWEGRRMAWLSVLGFAFVLFTYFGVNYLMSGMHAYSGA